MMAQWLENTDPTSWRLTKRWHVSDPAPTISRLGLGSGRWKFWQLTGDGMPTRPGRVPFHPLSMAAVHAAPANGLTHISTFSGCGGTCLGFALAGYRTLWANDLEAHARQCYSLNFSTPIDGRDIRHLTAEDILHATGLAPGALDVFEGSPPCTAFSTAGLKAKSWHKHREHAGIVQANVEDLFFDWIRILEGLRPRAFVAENVSGLIRGVSKGYFKDILRRLRRLDYRVEARVLDAQWLGVPQRRARVIFVGLRADVPGHPPFPAPQAFRYSMRDALPWIDDQGGDAIIQDNAGAVRCLPIANRPTPTITTTNGCHYLIRGEPAGENRTQRQPDGIVRRSLTIAELKRLCSFPDEFQLEGGFAKQWARLGNSVPPLMAYAIAAALRDVLTGAWDGRGRRVYPLPHHPPADP